jgi:hypothetical protein
MVEVFSDAFSIEIAPGPLAYQSKRSWPVSLQLSIGPKRSKVVTGDENG